MSRRRVKRNEKISKTSKNVKKRLKNQPFFFRFYAGNTYHHASQNLVARRIVVTEPRPRQSRSTSLDSVNLEKCDT